MAGPGGAAPLTELFQASGAVTMSLFFEETSNANGNTMGWYDPANPTVLHQILTGQQCAGASAVFTPVSSLCSLLHGWPRADLFERGRGQPGESVTQQHFALLVSAIPEPGTGRLAGIVLAAACADKFLWKHSHSTGAGCRPSTQTLGLSWSKASGQNPLHAVLCPGEWFSVSVHSKNTKAEASCPFTSPCQW